MINPKRHLQQSSTLQEVRFFGKDITNIENKDRSNPKSRLRSNFELEKSLLANKTKKTPLRRPGIPKMPLRDRSRIDIPSYLAQHSLRSFERSQSRQKNFNIPDAKKTCNIAEKIKQQLSNLYLKK